MNRHQFFAVIVFVALVIDGNQSYEVYLGEDMSLDGQLQMHRSMVAFMELAKEAQTRGQKLDKAKAVAMYKKIFLEQLSDADFRIYAQGSFCTHCANAPDQREHCETCDGIKSKKLSNPDIRKLLDRIIDTEFKLSN